MSIVDLNYLWEEAQHDLRVLVIREELKEDMKDDIEK